MTDPIVKEEELPDLFADDEEEVTQVTLLMENLKASVEAADKSLKKVGETADRVSRAARRPQSQPQLQRIFSSPPPASGAEK